MVKGETGTLSLDVRATVDKGVSEFRPFTFFWSIYSRLIHSFPFCNNLVVSHSFLREELFSWKMNIFTLPSMKLLSGELRSLISLIQNMFVINWFYCILYTVHCVFSALELYLPKVMGRMFLLEMCQWRKVKIIDIISHKTKVIACLYLLFFTTLLLFCLQASMTWLHLMSL